MFTYPKSREAARTIRQIEYVFEGERLQLFRTTRTCTDRQGEFQQITLLKIGLQCFDAVRWAAGRVSGL